jgi:hypothetical protein
LKQRADPKKNEDSAQQSKVTSDSSSPSDIPAQPSCACRPHGNDPAANVLDFGASRRQSAEISGQTEMLARIGIREDNRLVVHDTGWPVAKPEKGNVTGARNTGGVAREAAALRINAEYEA